MTDQPEPDAYSRRVAANVRVLRLRRRWSASQLADATEAHGLRISRAVIANQETGRRSNVSVDELVVYAAVLGVTVEQLLAEQPPVACQACLDDPPRGFTCNACGVKNG